MKNRDRDDRRSDSDTEPLGTPDSEPGKRAGASGNAPVREYPDEGERSHYPTAPATAKTPASPQADGASDDDPSAA